MPVNKKLAVVVICSDSPRLAEEAFEYLRKYSNSEITELILFDNGSQKPLDLCGADRIIRSETNLGMGQPIFYSRNLIDSEIIAFFHVDLRIVEQDWDKRVLYTFEEDPLLALAGIVGSKVIDIYGGRGFITDTYLNFQGNDYVTLTGSPAEMHGHRFNGYMRVANLDGCALIFRKKYLMIIPSFEDSGYPPAHYYDVESCCEALSRNQHIGLLGIASDHSGGGIGTCKIGGDQPGLLNRDKAYKNWLVNNNIEPKEDLNTQIYLIARQNFIKRWSRILPYRLSS